MMNNLWIKDWLILFSIHPKSGRLQQSNMMGYSLIAASLCDLIIHGRVWEESGTISIRQGETGDPVLDILMDKLQKYEGKKIQVFLNQQNNTANKLLKVQLSHLVQQRLMTETPHTWQGITWGKRYRLSKPNLLKSWITRLDRVLIYGRKPDVSTRILIGLLAMPGQQHHLYTDREQKKRALSRMKELSKDIPENFNPLFSQILKHNRKATKHHPSGVSGRPRFSDSGIPKGKR